MPPSPARHRDLVLGAAVLLIAAQIAFRGWALYGSWFYLDDLLLLRDAEAGPSLGYLVDPYYSQFMPWGRLVAWLVASSGTASWGTAATLTVLTQVVADGACLAMLATLFGARPGILLPLTVYLTGALTLPATMWWAASLNSLPLQIAFFGAVACWWRYLRGRRAGWLIATLLLVAFGLSAYVKALFLVPLLAGLAVAYFADGSLVSRMRQVLVREWRAVGATVVLLAVFLAYYLTHVPSIASGRVREVALPLAQEMLGSTLATAVLGGPWRWNEVNPPTGLAAPPDWAVVIAWIVLLGSAVLVAALRVRTGRAWALFAGYAGLSYVLLLTTRAPGAGTITGLELRYLTDVGCAWALVLGLVTMSLLGSPQGSSPRKDPPLRIALDPRTPAVVATALAISGTVSSVGYVEPWHSRNPSEEYFTTARASLAEAGPVDIADGVVPERVFLGFLFPRNLLSELLPIVAPEARFPSLSSDLVVIDDDGSARRALIDAATSVPQGPDGGCGWKVGGARTLPLSAPTIDVEWWIRIAYLGSADGPVRVTAGDRTFDTEVRRGPHNIFLRVEGAISEIRLAGAGDHPFCVDAVEVGQPVPGAPL